MGANQSAGPGVAGSERDWHRDRLGVQTHKSRDRLGHRDQLDGTKKSRGKPSPPQRPRVSHVTHNTISLAWHPPRHTVAVLAYTVEVSSSVERHWKVLTKACQGIHYEARYLQPNAEYVFRIRAENVYGVGKPSLPSDPAMTKEYDTDLTFGVSEQPEQQPKSPVEKTNTSVTTPGGCDSEKKTLGASLQRRHSFNVHLDGRVSSILNNSDMALNKSFPAPTPTTLQRTRAGSERTQTLTRSNFSRTSLPSSRKVSLPILLPGTGTNSVNRLRESRNSLRTSTSDNHISVASRDPTRIRLRESRSSLGSSVSDITGSIAPSDEARKRDSQGSLRSSGSDVTPSQSRDGCSTDDNSRDEGMCDCSTGNSDTMSTNNNVLNTWDPNSERLSHNGRDSHDMVTEDSTDDISQLKRNLKNLELTEEKLKFHDLSNRLHISDASFSKSDAQKGYYESLDNPWERDSSMDGVSDRIMAAPFCDDIKMALCAKNVNEDYPGFSANQNFEAERESGDFRTLQRVLQSNSMIVRASRVSTSDIVGVVMEEDGPAHLMRRGPLAPIMDEDEEDPVWVTSL